MDLNSFDLPKTLIRCKPDWHAAEVVSPRETDYYKSMKALGVLYRQIKLDEISDEEKRLVSTQSKPLTDPLSRCLLPRVKECIGMQAFPTGNFSEVEKIFKRYVGELEYISVTHTLSNTPGVQLLEAEIVAGTILAKCSQKRMRKDRIYRMRTHTEALVKDVQKDFQGKSIDTIDQQLTALKHAWRAWEYSQKFNNRYGANSFGFIALGVIFDCLEALGQIPPPKVSWED